MSQQITTYRTIEKETIVEFKDRGSRFIAFAYPVIAMEDTKRLLKKLKEEHQKAVHFCFAFRIGHDQNLYRAADDGEPAGSAGKPILGQIDSFKLSNIFIVVVRYFGGTLLGVPGLINAYKTAAHDAIQQATIVEKNIERSIVMHFNYTIMNEVMRVLKQYQLEIQHTDMGLFCSYTIAIPLHIFNDVIDKLETIQDVDIKIL